jgi:hypothetical protein
MTFCGAGVEVIDETLSDRPEPNAFAPATPHIVARNFKRG